MNSSVYGDIENWKKPLHISKNTLAKSYLKLLSGIDIIAITGSVGKTLTQNATASVLSQKYKTVVGEENLDPTFRIPKTILKVKPWDKKLVLEYGVEKPGDMSFYLKIAKPNVAVVTSVAPTHLKYFSNIHGVFDEKSKIISALPRNGFAILNADDENVRKMANITVAKVMFFGKHAEDGVKISHFSQDLQGSTFRLHFKGQKATVNWKIIGKHHLVSAYAAASVGITQGLTIKQIAKGLSLVKPPFHRLNPIATKTYKILDDSYNSSPKAAAESIKTIDELGKGLKKIVVLGEMRDLGEQSKDLHVKLGQTVAKSRVNYLFTIGKVAKQISDSAKKAGFKGVASNVSDTAKAIREIKKIAKKNSVILVKGSRHEHLERVVNGLQGKSTNVYCYHCGELN